VSLSLLPWVASPRIQIQRSSASSYGVWKDALAFVLIPKFGIRLHPPPSQSADQDRNYLDRAILWHRLALYARTILLSSGALQDRGIALQYRGIGVLGIDVPIWYQMCGYLSDGCCLV
jgi:hypothetical protein